MIPSLWFWAPQFHFPFSGSVAQHIDPKTSFFSAIKPEAGNGALEEKIFDVATYGRQLGWITEVLLGDNEADPALQDKARESLRKLKDAYREIEEVKDKARAALEDTAAAALQKLIESDTDASRRVLAVAAARLEAAESSKKKGL